MNPFIPSVWYISWAAYLNERDRFLEVAAAAFSTAPVLEMAGPDAPPVGFLLIGVICMLILTTWSGWSSMAAVKPAAHPLVNLSTVDCMTVSE